MCSLQMRPPAALGPPQRSCPPSGPSDSGESLSETRAIGQYSGGTVVSPWIDEPTSSVCTQNIIARFSRIACGGHRRLMRGTLRRMCS